MAISISIVIPTLGRELELHELLKSIELHGKFFHEVIIIDQNPPHYLDNIRARFNEYNFVNVNFKGVSKARNFGANLSTGDYVFFPDDDAEILSNSFEVILNSIKEHSPDLLTGKTVDREGNDSVIKYSEDSGFFNFSNSNGKFVEATIVIKRSLLVHNNFDEKLGVGQFYGAEEALDLIYRLKKSTMYYEKGFKIYHPPKVKLQNSFEEVKRVFSYRCGYSAFHYKHRMYLPVIRRILLIIFATPFMILHPKYSFRYYLAELLGLLTGIVVNKRSNWIIKENEDTNVNIR